MSHHATAWAYRQDIDICGAKFVLVALADFADEAWSCYPGQERLARMTGQGERTVRRHLEWLEEQGFLFRMRRSDGKGHRTSDRYVLAGTDFPTGQSGRLDPSLPANLAGSGNQTANLAGREGEIPSTSTNEIPTGQSGRLDDEIPTGQFRQSLPAKLAGEPLVKEPSEREGIVKTCSPAPPVSDYPVAFEEFWSHYPRKTGKRKALAAWKRARKRATDQQLLDGADRYSHDPNRADQFTKYAEGWLSGDSWLDEPLPSRNGHAKPNPTQRAQSILDMTAELLAEQPKEIQP